MERDRVRRLLRLPPRSRGELGAQVDEEIALHIALRAERLMAAGMSAREARAEAARRFGAMERAKLVLLNDATRRERRMGVREWLDGWRQDLRQATRSLWTERGLSAVVIATLALGVGANAVMFGIVDRLLLSGPAHVRNADRVGRLYMTLDLPGIGERTTSITGYAMYTALDGARAFEETAAYSIQPATIGRGPGARRMRVGYATSDMFELLGVRPALGRFFGPDEDRLPRGVDVAVLDWDFWRSEMGGDRSAIGRTVIVYDRPYTVIGVAPRGFTGPQMGAANLWMPISTLSPPRPDWPTTWRASWLNVIGRLAADVNATAASAEATARLRAAYDGDNPALRTARMSVLPLRFGNSGREPVEAKVTRWLAGVSLIVLLVACANVANLLLASAVRRRREIAVRLALGIGRARLVRLLLCRSVLLAGLGGAAALGIATWGGGLMRVTLLPAVHWSSPPLDGRVLAFSAALAVLTGLLVGLAPLLDAARNDLAGSMKAGGRGGGVGPARLRAALTVAQAALSVVLLVGAGLFVRSLWNIRHLDLGIEPDRVIVGEVVLPPHGPLSADERAELVARHNATFARALETVRGRADVESAALTIGTPFQTSFGVTLRVPGRDSIPALEGGGPYISAVTGGYFATVGTALLRGRDFTVADRAGSEPVVMVNETMAASLWPGEDPLAQCLIIGDQESPPCARVVGVVEEAKRNGLRDPPAMQYYIPFGQEVGFGGTTLLVRPRADAGSMTDPIRHELDGLFPGASYISVATLQESLDPEIRPWRLGATMFMVFGALALLIAAVGLYSVVSVGVAQRRGEIGIRMALGARSGNILSLIMRQGLTLVLTGVAIGLILALAGGPWIASLLFETSAHDVPTFAAVALTLLVTAAAASTFPAWRAAKTHPVDALRVE